VEFEAAIDRLEQSLVECPEQHWGSSLWVVKRSDPWMWPHDGVGDGTRTEEAIQVFSTFWLIAYHCLFSWTFTFGTARAVGQRRLSLRTVPRIRASTIMAQRDSQTSVIRALSCSATSPIVGPELVKS